MPRPKSNVYRKYFTFDSQTNTSTCMVEKDNRQCGHHIMGNHGSNLTSHIRRWHNDLVIEEPERNGKKPKPRAAMDLHDEVDVVNMAQVELEEDTQTYYNDSQWPSHTPDTSTRSEFEQKPKINDKHEAELTPNSYLYRQDYLQLKREELNWTKELEHQKLQMEAKRLELDEKKFELDRERSRQEYELKKLDLEQKERLVKYELELKYGKTVP
ncbi:uncharacterized protein LOC111518977 [Drosophila willistoni]|uniref:uncharacterized protein LOC111518977 n=1 Tax=Drosophila willistoni TaxID=7260 RepID=UPI00017D7EDD|nr:uncharacterized protein LOC111518977 [Drosophila willistoni]